MRIIGRLITLVIGLFAVTAAVAAVAARGMRERIVRRDDPGADEVTLAAIFEPLQFRSTAQHFRGGTVECWFGGGILDLREATLDPAGATLRVRAVFGGGQIVVPDDWQVETRVVGFGGITDTRPRIDRSPTAPRLVIEGVVLFGGFGISSMVPEDAEQWVRRGGDAGRVLVGTQGGGGSSSEPMGRPTD